MITADQLTNGSIWSRNGNKLVAQQIGENSWILFEAPAISREGHTEMKVIVRQVLGTDDLARILNEWNASRVTDWILALVKL